MFNPYHARPIGSERFEEHLKALMIEGIETQKAAKEAIPEYPVIPRAFCQEKRSYFDPIMEGYIRLANAVLAQAIYDYLDEYEHRLQLEDRDCTPSAYVYECRCLTIENEYFRQDDDRSALLDGVLRYVVHNPDDITIHRRMRRIQESKRRLNKIIHDD